MVLASAAGAKLAGVNAFKGEYQGRAPARAGRMTSFLGLVTLLVSASLAVSAADPFYIGPWKIVSAAPAPWASRELTPDEPEMKELSGKTITFKLKEIDGPRQAACKDPKYRVRNSPVEGLFQGMFDEMHRRDKSVDPKQMAVKAGFRGTSWKTLETGCGNELDFHFIDPVTAAFGLNNVIYTLKKQ
jgi:hypothetical protein